MRPAQDNNHGPSQPHLKTGTGRALLDFFTDMFVVGGIALIAYLLLGVIL